jgi:cellulose synthase/poly-beta-1,6-N-acetylglucosamine synthase-like glycosyltransferase
MITVLLVITILYLVKIALFASGALRASRPRSATSLPRVSVIVAARNEEHNIERCVRSLAALDYPRALLDIAIIDDQSTDGTVAILEELIAEFPFVRILRTHDAVDDLRGKANAIAQAIEQTDGEIIMTTDADCAVPPQWVRNTLAQYTPDVGCVCGFTLIRGDGMFAGIQSMDWAYLLTIASAGVGWGFALSAVGNNMSFRRVAYHDVGGYKHVGFSVTEDFILFKAIAYKSRWNIRYPVEPSTLVWSEPCADIKELFRQKKRWGRGGIDIHPVGFAIMSIGFLMNVALIATPLIGVAWWAWVAALAGKSAGDAFLLRIPLVRHGQARLYRYFALYELYYLIYVTILPFIVFLGGRTVWKGRKL